MEIGEYTDNFNPNFISERIDIDDAFGFYRQGAALEHFWYFWR